MKFNRKTMEKLDWTAQDAVLARKLRCSATTIWRWRRRLLKSNPSTYRAHPSLSHVPKRAGWDWTKTNAVLARENKLTRQRVHQIRKQLMARKVIA
jgi:hypothetical protein